MAAYRHSFRRRQRLMGHSGRIAHHAKGDSALGAPTGCVHSLRRPLRRDSNGSTGEGWPSTLRCRLSSRFCTRFTAVPPARERGSFIAKQGTAATTWSPRGARCFIPAGGTRLSSFQLGRYFGARSCVALFSRNSHKAYGRAKRCSKLGAVSMSACPASSLQLCAVVVGIQLLSGSTSRISSVVCLRHLFARQHRSGMRLAADQIHLQVLNA